MIRLASLHTCLDGWLPAFLDLVSERLDLPRVALLTEQPGPRGRRLTPMGCIGYKALKSLRFDPDSPLRKPIHAYGDELKGIRRSLGAAVLVAAPLGTEPIGALLADRGKRYQPLLAAELAEFELAAMYADGQLCRFQAEERAALTAGRLARVTELQDDLLTSLAAGVMSTNSLGAVQTWNPKMVDILGVAAGQALERPFVRLALLSLEERSAERLMEAFEAAMESGVTTRLWQQRITRLDHRQLTLNMVIAPLQQGGLAVVMEDVSDIVSLEANMERMRHLAQIGQLTAQIAHELRNPLTSIRGAAQILEHLDPDGPNAEFTRIILQEVNALNLIADEFLEFARPTQLNFEGIDINETLRKLAMLWEAHCAEHGVKVKVKEDRRITILWADSPRLNQVLRNLILNAVQAMPQGGTLTLSAALDQKMQEAVIGIKDTGSGMSPEQKERAFEPFFTTKTKGTGLGLPIVEKLVKAHGGRISIHSELGKGTTFELRLSTREPVR